MDRNLKAKGPNWKSAGQAPDPKGKTWKPIGFDLGRHLRTRAQIGSQLEGQGAKLEKRRPGTRPWKENVETDGVCSWRAFAKLGPDWITI